MSTIEKRDDVFCESSTGPGRWYCNARAYAAESVAQIEPSVEGFQYLGNSQFRWDMVWQADEPAPRHLRAFVHFYTPRSTRTDKIGIQDDHDPAVPPEQWAGTIRYSRTITMPADAEGDYVAAAGLYDADGRLALRGRVSSAGGNAMLLGTLSVRRENGRIAGVTFTPATRQEESASRMNLARKPVDFGFAVTAGAFRVQATAGGLTVTPLPDIPGFELSLRLDQLGHAGGKVASVTAVSPEGARGPVAFRQEADILSFSHQRGVFGYEVAF
jgi:hypothetical protein